MRLLPTWIIATIAALFGGMASAASGGDFAEGALTAMVVYLYNELTLGQSMQKLYGEIKSGRIARDAGKAVKRGYNGAMAALDGAPEYAKGPIYQAEFMVGEAAIGGKLAFEFLGKAKPLQIRLKSTGQPVLRIEKHGFSPRLSKKFNLPYGKNIKYWHYHRGLSQKSMQYHRPYEGGW